MNTTLKTLMLGLITVLLLPACNSSLTVIKRKVNKGYYIDYSRTKTKATKNDVVGDSKTASSVNTQEKTIYSDKTLLSEAIPSPKLNTESTNDNNQVASIEVVPTEKNKVNAVKIGSEDKNKSVSEKRSIPKELDKILFNPFSKKNLSKKTGFDQETHFSQINKHLKTKPVPASGALSLLWIVIVVLLILWLLGLLAGGWGLGGLINLLLVVALILLILWLLRII